MKEINREIYNSLNCFNTYADELPLKDENSVELDYINNIYVTYSITNSNDGTYKNIYDLEIQVITNKANKFEAEEIISIIDKKINKKVLTKARITKKNAWLIHFIDEENKLNAVLQYDLNRF